MRTRRPWLCVLFLAAIVASVPTFSQDSPAGTEAGTGSGEKDEPKSRRLSLTFRYYFNPIPKTLKSIDFWFPTPPEDDAQTVVNRVYQAPYKVKVETDEATGNAILYMHSGLRGGVPLQVRVSYSLERREILNGDLSDLKPEKEAEPTEEEKKIRELWLGSDSLMEIDRKTRSQAGKITKGLNSPVKKARAIYDWVVQNIALTPRPQDFPNAGFGNLAATLESKAGDATDLASVFVGLCRAANIPARNVIGMKVPPRVAKGGLFGHHIWAEFWVAGHQWVPVDPADGFRYAKQRDYYFGSLDENRIVISRGRDIKLTPPQSGQKLNFFFGGYWEGDEKPMPNPNLTVNFEELQTLPEPNRIPLGAGS